MRVLGIETSCDETAAALYDRKAGLRAETVHSQIKIHADFGGVVPELAARDHIRKLMPVVRQTMTTAGIAFRDLDGVAYTAGPGLAGALLTGAVFSRSLAWSLQIPSLGVNHMEGHLLTAMLDNEALRFPFLALLVSGGHTLLVQANGLGDYKILGESVDDAVGEAFDKTAKLLGLPYPGGPELAKLAESGQPERFDLSLPMVKKPGLDFSFSGLKTQVLVTVRSLEKAGKFDSSARADMASAFQDVVVKTLLIKCQRAVRLTGTRRLVVAGGVSANKALRDALKDWAEQAECELHLPPVQLCTDNGAMIAYTGCLRLSAGEQDSGLAVRTRPIWPIDELKPPLA